MRFYCVSVLSVNDFHYLYAVLNPSQHTGMQMSAMALKCVFFSPIEIYTRGMSLQAHQERTAAKNVFSGWYRAVLNSTIIIINHEKMVCCMVL